MSGDKFDIMRAGLAEFAETGRAPSFFADDFVWDFSGFEGWVEDSEYHGVEGFDRQMERWTEPFESWTMEISDLIDAGGEDILGIGVQRGVLKGSAAAVEMPIAQIWTVRDGKLRRLRIFATPDDAYQAAGLTPPR